MKKYNVSCGDCIRVCLYNCICVSIVFLRVFVFVFQAHSCIFISFRLCCAGSPHQRCDKDAIQWCPPSLEYNNDLNSYCWFKMSRIAPILIMVTVILSCYHDDDDELKRKLADNDVDQKSSHCSISK